MLYCSLYYCESFSATAKLQVPNFCVSLKDVLKCERFKDHIDSLGEDDRYCPEGSGAGKCLANKAGYCVEMSGLDVYRCPRRYMIIATDAGNKIPSTEATKKNHAKKTDDPSTFKSSQTGSVYKIVNASKDVFVCFRDIGNAKSRIRIQGPPDRLEKIHKHLAQQWGGVKDGDHLSIVCKGPSNLANAVGDAIRAMLLAGYN